MSKIFAKTLIALFADHFGGHFEPSKPNPSELYNQKLGSSLFLLHDVKRYGKLYVKRDV